MGLGGRDGEPRAAGSDCGYSLFVGPAVGSVGSFRPSSRMIMLASQLQKWRERSQRGLVIVLWQCASAQQWLYSIRSIRNYAIRSRRRDATASAPYKFRRPGVNCHNSSLGPRSLSDELSIETKTAAIRCRTSFTAPTPSIVLSLQVCIQCAAPR